MIRIRLVEIGNDTPYPENQVGINMEHGVEARMITNLVVSDVCTVCNINYSKSLFWLLTRLYGALEASSVLGL